MAQPVNQQQIGELVDALRSAGMTIPDEATDLNGVIVAILSQGVSWRDRDDDDDEDGSPQTSGETQPAPGAPMLMSDGRGLEPHMARRFGGLTQSDRDAIRFATQGPPLPDRLPGPRRRR